ncbi:eukaryotic elongation factor 2 kinase-like isoform X1 [Mytilus californianus]|uniref:eukaryotic elongation factor 2 kinase-like isoform X1 n=1 Tax=Mytilus californianus TaxID=6549 RepID=UPI002247462B|nr:eukaryotic elongation factor 2 kinase-like isoform X1 [Mytilus californianus]
MSHSSSASSDGEIMLFPITLFDDDDYGQGGEASDERESESENEEKPKAFMTLRQRRLSRALANAPSIRLDINKNLNASRAKINWLKAIRRARDQYEHDPWSKFHIEQIQTEMCIRHRYNPHKKIWCTDEVQVKMQTKPFTRGAMRQCYRTKKLSKFSSAHSQDWNHALNYVSKRYIEEVDRDVYFQDVKLQMDAKVWAEEYNRHNPPKKVDMMQMYILEFKNRKGSPLYHLEHYIEGNYVKYNSNSGFVEDSLRYTPQALSHFTFERSDHQLIVVDIQGVGDLYTDPQIHTFEGTEYGDGNLGAKGIALFFHSHVCNEICHSLSLTEFDLSPKELQNHQNFLRKQRKSFMMTRVRGTEEHCHSLSRSPGDMSVDITEFLRQRSSSSHISDSAVDSPSPGFDDDPMSIDSPVNLSNPGNVRFRCMSESDSQSSMTADVAKNIYLGLTNIYLDVLKENSVSKPQELHKQKEERIMFQRMAAQRARPSCVALEKDLRKLNNLRIGDSILGKVHHEMAKYHEVGRFVMGEDLTGENIDWESAIFHEEHAAELGELEAIVTMAKLYLNLERDVLANCTVEQTEENKEQGIQYMIQAAEAGDRGAMLYMAKAFETGEGLNSNRSISWEDAIHYYNLAVKTDNHDEGGEYDSTINDPLYQIQAKQAELYRYGGHGLQKDASSAGDLYNEAAEAAMASMKGRLANKYFALAEECYGEVEEEEESEQ